MIVRRDKTVGDMAIFRFGDILTLVMRFDLDRFFNISIYLDWIALWVSFRHFYYCGVDCGMACASAVWMQACKGEFSPVDFMDI